MLKVPIILYILLPRDFYKIQELEINIIVRTVVAVVISCSRSFSLWFVDEFSNNLTD